MKLLLDLGFLCFGLAIVASLFLAFSKSEAAKRKVPAFLQMLAAFCVLIGAVRVFLTNDLYRWSFTYLNMFDGIQFMMDRLAAFFVMLICLVVIPVSLYSAGYLKEYRNKYSLTYFNFFTSVFIAAMLMVVLSQNLLFFIVAWELMSVSSYFLVLFENRKRPAVDASSLYVIMTHMGALFLIVGFALLGYYTQRYNFFEMPQMLALVPGWAKNLIFVSVFIAFGSKAGLIPLHIWLPEAHPAAPSNVSALMSGVMLKVAVYGFVRVFFDVLSFDTLWWWILVALLGAVTAFIGIVYAVIQKDMKRFLAFSSVENLGIIFATLGVAGILRFYNNMELSNLALAAALFHSMNHAIYKSLLFLGAGNIIYATHTRNLDELGGLAKRMPRTAVWFFIGTAAIAALPPLNGFVSEWAILMATIQGLNALTASGAQITLLMTGMLLALTAGSALYGFVTLYGVIFSGSARTGYDAHFTRPEPVMEHALAILGVTAVALALGASWILAKLHSPMTFGSMPFIMGALILATGVIYWTARRINPKETVEVGETWGCGFNNLHGGLQYTAKGFVQPYRKVFQFILKTDKRKQFAKQAFKKEKLTIEHSLVDLFEVYIYKPTIHWTQQFSELVSRIQLGYIQMYILYIMIALVVVLIQVLSY